MRVVELAQPLSQNKNAGHPNGHSTVVNCRGVNGLRKLCTVTAKRYKLLVVWLSAHLFGGFHPGRFTGSSLYSSSENLHWKFSISNCSLCPVLESLKNLNRKVSKNFGNWNAQRQRMRANSQIIASSPTIKSSAVEFQSSFNRCQKILGRYITR